MNSRRNSGRRRSKLGVLIAVVVAAIVVLIVVLVVWYLLAGRLPKPGPPGPTQPGPTPNSQPASCPDVQVVAVPGTWESSATDDPHNPTANPAALMLNVTRPLQNQFPGSRVDVYTVPYVAQFSNPIAFPPDGQQSYNNSRTAGTRTATDVLTGMHANCPLTNFVLAGFSQGAVIAGDIAAQIGADNGPVPANEVLGVTLIADGRRFDNQAEAVGPQPPGEGAEVTLKGLSVPGIKMTGPRPGFGSLSGKVNTICAPGDLICDAPREAMNPVNMPGAIAQLVGAYGNPVHTMYNTFVVDPSGTTATQWTVKWAEGLINSAPTPAHS